MSYNVANGFVFLEGPECFPRLIREARAALGIEAKNLLKQEMFGMAVDAFDRRTVILAGLSSDSRTDDTCFMSSSFRKLTKRDGWLDSSIAIHEFEGRYYGRFFSQRPELRRLFHESRLIAPFGFWDNTDKDPDVPDEEWEERRRVWYGIDRDRKDGLSNILEANLTLTSHLVHTSIGRDEIAAFLPDLDTRVATQVRDLVLAIAVTDPADFGQISTILDRCASGQMPIAQRLTDIVKPLLKPVPEAIDLWGWEP